MNDFPSIDHLTDWPDVEDLMCTYLERFGRTVTETDLSDDGRRELETFLGGGGVLIEINRAGGGAPDGLKDIAPIVVKVTTARRSRSWRVMNNQIRKAVKVAENGVAVDGVLLDSMSETGDLSLVPGLDPDDRSVEMLFLVTCRRPRF
ncbi:phage tail termination protein [Prescottella equi]|uniref:phage tail termination protein n=1 Tax=Rhodococcus hoagii TaxID=43767 RepID=UPI0007CD57B1|nr:hypothetical protein [Prescottella equi]